MCLCACVLDVRACAFVCFVCVFFSMSVRTYGLIIVYNSQSDIILVMMPDETFDVSQKSAMI